MQRRRIRLFILLTVIAVVAAACSGVAIEEDNLSGVSSSTDTTPIDLEGADRVLQVELTEFAIDASSFDFAPGETVKFMVTNAGVVQHEFRLSNIERVTEHLDAGHDAHADDADMDMEDTTTTDAGNQEKGHEEAAEDVILLLEGGESGVLLFTFPDTVDEYTVAVCLVPGHYEAGMTTDLSYGA